jgi:hypothetical protein
MRYFFNAGGKVKLSLTGPAGSGRNADWRTLCTAMGTIIFGYNRTTKSGGSGTPNTLLSTAGNGGFWGTSTSGTDRRDFKQFSTGTAYDVNYIEVLTKITGAAGSNGGKGVTLTFTINLVDDNTNTFQPAVASGTEASLVIAEPDSESITASWGSITTAVTKQTDAGDTEDFEEPAGSTSYTTPGTYTFTVPDDVTSVSVVCVGPGGTGSSANVGGAGGGLGYVSSLTVEPGQRLYVQVGSVSADDGAVAGQSIVSTTTPVSASVNFLMGAKGYGAGYEAGATQTSPAPAPGTGFGQGTAFNSYVGRSGGRGGPSTFSGGKWGDAGGGGAAGYGGNGGNGGYTYQNTGSQVILTFGAVNGGAGGGGSGGETSSFVSTAGGGGGVGIFGIGAGGSADGRGGSGGSNGSAVGGTGRGGNHGGGGSSKEGIGGTGAVRIIWGPGASYPSNAS